jgi:hypothetical protein
MMILKCNIIYADMSFAIATKWRRKLNRVVETGIVKK